MSLFMIVLYPYTLCVFNMTSYAWCRTRITRYEVYKEVYLCFYQSSTYTRAAAAAHSLEFEISWCRMSQLARHFLPAQTCVWNDLYYAVFCTGTLIGFKEAVNRWLLPWVVSVFRGVGACGVAKCISKHFNLAYAACFNMDNNTLWILTSVNICVILWVMFVTTLYIIIFFTAKWNPVSLYELSLCDELQHLS